MSFVDDALMQRVIKLGWDAESVLLNGSWELIEYIASCFFMDS